ncbi:endolytic transglycosylase MltG [Chryseobacterium caseinilyticum]|uniref:Endolytic murein transglycosylase n=1 Tax=Chryseobacterium caseinilyticum TaxID=2771428 RepID=A0ABR8Z859_9FLAO|nr:endolytic transglycosylase MltG [Chryseobacterium caseinilyticum]MBD8081396.1 endolytic transglycosylase MltG [Chryseobacterium caseinilyticum]
MRKAVIIVVLLLIVVGGFFGFKFYKKNYGNNIQKDGYVLIPHGAEFKQIIDSAAKYVDDKAAFESVATEKDLPKNFKPGRYHFKKGMGNSDLVNMIKAGNQSENSFRIGDFGDIYQMVGKVTKKTETDSLQFVNELYKIAVDKGYTSAEDLKKHFFIDTYNFYWTVTPAEFFKKFDDQYKEFWNAERKAKEAQSGLSRDQIYALASIVFKESGGKPDEMKTIAGLYLNRYKKDMKLQSDPTVIYAMNKQNNFKESIKRVLYKHLSTPSPFNTYANKGIPPGPICITDKNSVDAVLNAEKNDFIFMCADPSRPGLHKFTDNAEEHAANAKVYQDWLNSRNIK